jgi:uncharacterized membrane protein (UPF0127 family)
MKRNFATAFAVLAALAIVAVVLAKDHDGYAHATVSVGDVHYDALVSDTDALRERGLSGLSRLDDGTAMLFIFPTAAFWPFWMKDMRFPIDIVWIGEDGRVVTVKENVSPSTYPQTFAPEKPAINVIEIPAGDAAKAGIKAGETQVSISR